MALLIKALIFTYLLTSISEASDRISEVYRWTNDDGSISFSDNIGNVPAKHRKSTKVEQYERGETRIAPPAPPKKARKAARSEPIGGEDTPHRVGVAVQKPESSKELSEEEKKKIDEDVRRTWADMKKALSGRENYRRYFIKQKELNEGGTRP